MAKYESYENCRWKLIYPPLGAGKFGEKLYTRCIKKKRNLGIFQEIDIVLRTKDLGAWEFKIAQLSKLLHTRVHKAKFMHLFNSTTTVI